MINSWLNISTKELAYHIDQYENVYSSTKQFCDYLDELGLIKSRVNILDVACGGGANTYYMKQRWQKNYCGGIDINADLIKLAQSKSKNVFYEVKDLYDIMFTKHTSYGITCLQTLSWLPTFKEPWEKLLSCYANFVAVSSLFYEGELSYSIQVCDHNTNKINYYNVYSLDVAEFWANKYGYKLHYKKFNIDIDIPKSADKGLGTYTTQTVTGERLQISGALLLPWYFVVAVKEA